MPHVELSLPAATSSVAVARGTVLRTLRSWGRSDLEWTGAQAVTELVTNAVIHAGTPFTLVLSTDGEQVRVEVRDGSRRMPRQRHYGLTATTGRGLALVDALTREWGAEPGEVGKTVWCVLTGEAGAAGEADGDVDLDAFLSAEDRVGFP